MLIIWLRSAEHTELWKSVEWGEWRMTTVVPNIGWTLFELRYKQPTLSFTLCRQLLAAFNCAGQYYQGSFTLPNNIFHTFSILNEKNLIPSLVIIFPKFYSQDTMQKPSAKLPSAAKNKILINKWLNLEFPYFFNTLCTFCLDSKFLKVSKTDFTIQYFYNTTWQPWIISRPK